MFYLNLETTPVNSSKYGSIYKFCFAPKILIRIWYIVSIIYLRNGKKCSVIMKGLYAEKNLFITEVFFLFVLSYSMLQMENVLADAIL